MSLKKVTTERCLTHIGMQISKCASQNLIMSTTHEPWNQEPKKGMRDYVGQAMHVSSPTGCDFLPPFHVPWGSGVRVPLVQESASLDM